MIARKTIKKSNRKILKFAIDIGVVKFDLRGTVEPPEAIEVQKGPFSGEWLSANNFLAAEATEMTLVLSYLSRQAGSNDI